MRTRFINPLIATIVCGLYGSPSYAHHSTAMFDSSKRVTLQGTVKKFMFTNPHSLIYLAVVDAMGTETVWELVGGTTSRMARNGWTYESIKAGDKVTVSISPRIDGAAGGAFNGLTLSDGTTLRFVASDLI